MPRGHVTRSDPALDPLLRQALADQLGALPVLRSMADEYVPAGIRHHVLPTGGAAVVKLSRPYPRGSYADARTNDTSIDLSQSNGVFTNRWETRRHSRRGPPTGGIRGRIGRIGKRPEVVQAADRRLAGAADRR